MDNKCRTYDLDMLSAFVDNELDPERYHEIKVHLDTCPGCRKTVNQYAALSEHTARIIAGAVDGIDTSGLARQVSQGVSASGSNQIKKVFDYFSLKSYLKIATVAAMMVIAVVFYQGRPVSIPEPSAIVTSVDANMASVMIFETQNEKHTVIWFTET